MSRFIDKLNRLVKSTPQPLGFRRAGTDSPKPKIQLVASLPGKDADSLADRVAGSDAVLFHISKSEPNIKAIEKISQALPDVFWGVWLEGTTQIDMKELVKAGSDFLIFPADFPLTAFQDGGVGKILEIEASLSEGMLRAINGLPVDAVLMNTETKEEHPLTWQNLITFQRLADFVAKPLLASAASDVTADELQALWKAGIDGIIIEVTREQSGGRIKELRQLIDSLDFPLPRRRQKAEPTVPHSAAGLISLSAHEEEEEEE